MGLTILLAGLVASRSDLSAIPAYLLAGLLLRRVVPPGRTS